MSTDNEDKNIVENESDNPEVGSQKSTLSIKGNKSLLIKVSVALVLLYVGASMIPSNKTTNNSSNNKSRSSVGGKEHILESLLDGKNAFTLESNPVVGHLDPEDPSVRLAVSMKKTEYPRFNVNLLKVGMARDRENRYSLHFEISSKKCLLTTMSHENYSRASLAQDEFAGCLNEAVKYVDDSEREGIEVDSNEIERIIHSCSGKGFSEKLVGKTEEVAIKYCEALYRQKL